MFAQFAPSGDQKLIVSANRLGFMTLLVAVTLLLFAAVPSTQAQGTRCSIWDRRHTFWMSSSGFISGTVPIFANSNCTPPSEGTLSAGEHGIVDSWDRQAAIDKCNKYNGYTNNQVRAFGIFWSCRPSKDTGSGSSNGKGKSNGKDRSSTTSRRTIVPAGPPTGVLIQEFGIKVSATLGLESGIQFQRRDAGAVGIPSVIDMGFRDAVDVWGAVNGNYEVCFPQAGAIIFLDASTSPRTVSSIEHFTRDGLTCAAHETAGMLVLVVSSDSSTATESSSSTGSTVDPGPISPLSNCEITTLYRLNLRDEPDGEVIHTIVPHQVSLDATARTTSWFKVTYEEWEGWLAARYLGTYGSCRAGMIT